MARVTLTQYYQKVAQYACAIPGCYQPCELHHINGGISLKTGQVLPRRKGLAEALVVPLCAEHHRTGPTAVHALGEAGFEEYHEMPKGALMALAGSFLAAFITGDL